MTRRVVIAYDGSEASADALEFGLTWCRSTGDVPIVATIYPQEHPLGTGPVDVEWTTQVRDLGQGTLQQARAVAGEAALYRLVPSSSAPRGLVELAESVEAAAIVVGGSGGEARRRGLLGSTTDRLLHGGSVAVIVVPLGASAPDRGQLSRIGVAFIDTRDGHEALRVAVRAAIRIPARLTLYTVVAGFSESFSYVAGRRDEARVIEAVRDSYGKALEFAAAGIPVELEPRLQLLEGDVVQRLAHLAPEDVDLLVCGSRGYGPVRRVLLGGVSSRLVRVARLPVAVVPRPGRTAWDFG